MEEVCSASPEHRSPFYWRLCRFDLLWFTGLMVPIGLCLVGAALFSLGQ